jgi:hypothetical protein
MIISILLNSRLVHRAANIHAHVAKPSVLKLVLQHGLDDLQERLSEHFRDLVCSPQRQSSDTALDVAELGGADPAATANFLRRHPYALSSRSKKRAIPKSSHPPPPALFSSVYSDHLQASGYLLAGCDESALLILLSVGRHGCQRLQLEVDRR